MILKAILTFLCIFSLKIFHITVYKGYNFLIKIIYFSAILVHVGCYILQKVLHYYFVLQKYILWYIQEKKLGQFQRFVYWLFMIKHLQYIIIFTCRIITFSCIPAYLPLDIHILQFHSCHCQARFINPI